MSTTVHAYAAMEPGATFEPFEYELPELGYDEVDIKVTHCGICHSDLSMLDNDWGQTTYPFVPGHENVGIVEAVGPGVTSVQVGDTVGVGWHSGSCLQCDQCLSGDQNMCSTAEQTIVGRHGGFADRLRARQTFCIKLPDHMNPVNAGPLFCGGITMFNPLIQLNVRPTDRVGVIGIGGLGHMGLMFLKHWGCHVTAFSTSPDKQAEAMELGATDFIVSQDEAAMNKHVNSFDVILSTVNVKLDWDLYVSLLKPRGRLHSLGAVLDFFGTSAAFPLIAHQKSLSGSPVGSPQTIHMMLDFCARHQIEPVTEHYPLEKVNDAMDRLRHGKPRYRVVLDV